MSHRPALSPSRHRFHPYSAQTLQVPGNSFPRVQTAGGFGMMCRKVRTRTEIIPADFPGQNDGIQRKFPPGILPFPDLRSCIHKYPLTDNPRNVSPMLPLIFHLEPPFQTGCPPSHNHLPVPAGKYLTQPVYFLPALKYLSVLPDHRCSAGALPESFSHSKITGLPVPCGLIHSRHALFCGHFPHLKCGSAHKLPPLPRQCPVL